MATCNEIPEDVVIEILLRLPVKSLIRYRVVCKNWYSIIKNPSFVTKHLNHHRANSGSLFVKRFDKITDKYVFSLYPDQTLAGSPLLCEDVVVNMSNNLQISACNGILCLHNCIHHHRCFALWNPATREFRSVPVLPRNFPPNVVNNLEAFGFGFDPITNDYKLVWMWNTLEFIRETRYGPYKAAVYTLSTDSWRYLDVALPYSTIHTPQSNTFINGVYHWFCLRAGDQHRVILSFDMGNELFHEIRDIPSSDYGYYADLAPYDNSLALIYSESGPFVEIWVMMEEGCWTKHLTVELLLKHKSPLGFWKNGQLIVETVCDGHVGLYDPETREITDLVGSQFWVEFLIYKESLVAVRSRDGFLQQNQLSDVEQVLNLGSI
ncbi:F-box/kelch-repeat protein At3g06240-like isoform X1 [Cornus florida]|uniref:F-box/kelch-repeat protein At3g06240-like isoform X1 n=1 Tax=Cornus florida TaxID=4283 RepID=UPI0028A0DB2F|nr:F-box/kelch-repeat protein At3g06240-like isoform X1 [Cornus florida]XP_059640109.1 F-box/kelch-repeat protein At3g06240-like isoform X1 [Cornus florida]XP_059640110.1 F-box/kelch-repeat protein At3g06240-like isoform X1 [Cornus florida]